MTEGMREMKESLSLINAVKDFLGISLKTHGKEGVLEFLNEFRNIDRKDRKEWYKMLEAEDPWLFRG